MAEREGFEPPERAMRSVDFESTAFDQLGHLSAWDSFLTYRRENCQFIDREKGLEKSGCVLSVFSV